MASRPGFGHRQCMAARTGTGTAKHRPAWRRGEAPARLRPDLNKKPATREGSRQGKGGRYLNAAAGLGWVAYFMRETVERVPIR